jgi:YD repeat-containing protein
LQLRGTLDLILSRHYASDETCVGPLGRSIATSIDVSITETPEGELVYLQSVHRRIRFARPSLFPHIWTRNDADKNLALSFANLDILLLKEDGLFRRFTRQPDGVWRLAAIEDRNGNRITLERDPRGLITRIDHPDELSLAFDNDAAGRRTGVTLVGTDGTRCPLLRYRYDACANLVAAESTCGPSHHDEHDAAGRRVAWTDGLTTRSRRVYDAQGRVVLVETRGADRAPTSTTATASRTIPRTVAPCTRPAAGRRSGAGTITGPAGRSPPRRTRWATVASRSGARPARRWPRSTPRAAAPNTATTPTAGWLR